MSTAHTTVKSSTKHESQQHTLYATVEHLISLREANDAHAYSGALTWARSLPGYIRNVVLQNSPGEHAEQTSNSRLLQLLYSSISNGLYQLAGKGWEDLALVVADSTACRDAVETRCILCQELLVLSSACRLSRGPGKVAQSKQIAIARETGVLHTMFPFLVRLLPALEPLQHSAVGEISTSIQQQLTAEQSLLPRLAASLLQIWVPLFMYWPGCRFGYIELTAPFPVVASIALALMRIPPPAAKPQDSAGAAETGDVDACSDQSTGPNSTAHFSKGDDYASTAEVLYQLGVCSHFEDWCSVGFLLAHMITVAAHHQLSLEPTADPHSAMSAELFRAATAPADVQRLLLVSVAAAAAAAARLNGSSNTAAVQKGLKKCETAGYEHLLSAIGLPERLMDVSPATAKLALELCGKRFNANFIRSVLHCAFALPFQHYIQQQQQQQRRHPNGAKSLSNSKISSNGRDTTTLDQCTAPADGDLVRKLSWPLLLTLKDLALLLPDGRYEPVLLELFQYTCMCSSRSASGASWLPKQQQQEVLQWLLQALYSKVAAAVNKVQDDGTAATSASKAVPSQQVKPQSCPGELLESWLKVTGGYLHHVLFDDATAANARNTILAGIFAKDHHSSLAATEAYIRLSSSGGSSSRTNGPAYQADAMKLGAAIIKLLDDMTSARDTSPAIVTLHGLLAKYIIHQELISLLCSVSKLAASNLGGFQKLQGLLMRLLKLYCRQLASVKRTIASRSGSAAPGVSTTSTTAAANASVQQQNSGTDASRQQLFSSCCRLAVVAGRTMCAEAKVMQLQQQHIDIAAVAETATRWLRVGNRLVKSELFGKQNQKIRKEFEWLRHHLKFVHRGLKGGQWAVTSRGADFSELMNLFKTQGFDGLTDENLQKGQKRQVIRQLQQCGSALCAALPVKFCCNNPACVNLAKLSEQQLVAGKGSRCSGCKVARYCSRDCQLKHWKQHKKACKRLQAATHSYTTKNKNNPPAC